MIMKTKLVRRFSYWKEIERDLLENKDSPKKVTEVKTATRIHPQHLAGHKEELEKEGLIKVDIPGWKKGQKNLEGLNSFQLLLKAKSGYLIISLHL